MILRAHLRDDRDFLYALFNGDARGYGTADDGMLRMG
jgi:hypothetical protein